MTLPAPGFPLALPWVDTPQWTDGEQNSDLKMHKRFDVPMDALRARNNLSGQFVRYLGIVNPGSATAVGQQIPWLALIDNLGIGGGVGGIETIVVPPPGQYIISCGLRGSFGASGNYDWALSVEGGRPPMAGAPNAPATYPFMGNSLSFTRRLRATYDDTTRPFAGAPIEVFPVTGGLVTADATYPMGSYLSIHQVGW